MRRLIVGLVAVVVVRCVALADGAMVLQDDFGDGTLAPLWSANAIGTGSVTEGIGKLNASVAASSSQGMGWASSNFELNGDFDVSVDFGNYGPSKGLSRQAHLLLAGSDPAQLNGQMKIIDYPYGSFTRAYNLYFPNHGINFFVPTTDTSGSFRMAREGNTFSGYYRDGTSWVLLGSGSAWAESCTVWLGAVNGIDYPAVNASFDNFAASADQITGVVPEPASLAVWSVLGLAGIGAGIWLRRRRHG